MLTNQNQENCYYCSLVARSDNHFRHFLSQEYWKMADAIDFDKLFPIIPADAPTTIFRSTVAVPVTLNIDVNDASTIIHR